jgi:hypothetical protein
MFKLHILFNFNTPAFDQWHHPPTHTHCKYLGAAHTMRARLHAVQARVKAASLSRAVEAAAPAPIVMRPGMSRRVVAPAPQQAPRAVLTSGESCTFLTSKWNKN